MYLRGHTFRAMVKALAGEGIRTNVATIHGDVKRLREQWKEERKANFESALAVELEKLDAVEAAAWDAWEKSGREFYTRTKQKGHPSNQNGVITITTVGAETTTFEQDGPGDPRFLLIITRCSEQRSRLLGLFKVSSDSDGDTPGGSGMIPASFAETPTFVVVGGTKDMIESEDDLPDE